MEKVFDIQPNWLPENFQLQAKEELRETPEVRAKAIEELKKLLAENKDLYYPNDDDFLTVFLRPTKFYPESALKLVSRLFDYNYLTDCIIRMEINLIKKIP